MKNECNTWSCIGFWSGRKPFPKRSLLGQLAEFASCFLWLHERCLYSEETHWSSGIKEHDILVYLWLQPSVNFKWFKRNVYTVRICVCVYIFSFMSINRGRKEKENEPEC